MSENDYPTPNAPIPLATKFEEQAKAQIGFPEYINQNNSLEEHQTADAKQIHVLMCMQRIALKQAVSIDELSKITNDSLKLITARRKLMLKQSELLAAKDTALLIGDD